MRSELRTKEVCEESAEERSCYASHTSHHQPTRTAPTATQPAWLVLDSTLHSVLLLQYSLSTDGTIMGLSSVPKRGSYALQQRGYRQRPNTQDIYTQASTQQRQHTAGTSAGAARAERCHSKLSDAASPALLAAN